MFIPALLVATCAVALYEKLEAIWEEGAIACVAVGLVSIITTVVVAPWPFHLLMVLVVLALKFSSSNSLFSWSSSEFLKHPFSLGTSMFKRFK